MTKKGAFIGHVDMAGRGNLPNLHIIKVIKIKYLILRRTSAKYSNFGVVGWCKQDRLTGALVEEHELI